MTLNDRDRYGEKKSQRNFLPLYNKEREKEKKSASRLGLLFR